MPAGADERSWREAAFVAVDFEATEADPRRAEPLSVGWVPVRGGRAVVGAAGYLLIRFTGHIPAEGMRVHGLTPAHVADATGRDEVGRTLGGLLHGGTLVAHHAVLELAMLRRCGVRVPRRAVVDTGRLAGALERLEGRWAQRSQALPELAAQYGVPVHPHHHALGDALTTAGVFLALATGLEGHGAARLRDLRRLGRP